MYDAIGFLGLFICQLVAFIWLARLEIGYGDQKEDVKYRDTKLYDLVFDLHDRVLLLEDKKPVEVNFKPTTLSEVAEKHTKKRMKK